MIVLTIPVMAVPVRIFWEDTHASVSPVNVSTPITLATSAFLVSLMLRTNTRHSPPAGLMLAQRRRRCANINSALGECLVFEGYHVFIFAQQTVLMLGQRRRRWVKKQKQ